MRNKEDIKDGDAREYIKKSEDDDIHNMNEMKSMKRKKTRGKSQQ